MIIVNIFIDVGLIGIINMMYEIVYKIRVVVFFICIFSIFIVSNNILFKNYICNDKYNW